MPTNDRDQPLTMSDAERRLLDKKPDVDREQKLDNLLTQLQPLSQSMADTSADVSTPSALEYANIALEIAGLLLDLDRKTESWDYARPSIDAFIAQQKFEDAALACQYVYLANQFDALPAIGQGAWLAVTYPIDPHLTANILEHIIDETPDHSDGAAVAAATAHYVADIRSTDANRDALKLFTGAMLARVARRHSNIDTQADFERWVERMDLDLPEKFLGRLRNVVDVLVQTDWWFDRDELQAMIPDDSGHSENEPP